MSLGDIMKQAQEMQSKMQGMQEEMKNLTVTGEAGAGLVKVTMNGSHDVEGVFIDASLLPQKKDDEEGEAGSTAEAKEMLEDLIAAATNDAVAKVEKASKDKMSQVTGGMNLPPNFKMPF